MAAIHKNSRWDLLSLKVEPVTLWKGTNIPLTRTTLNKIKMLEMLLGCASEREKQLGDHETLIRIEYMNGNTIYLTLKDSQAEANEMLSISNTEVLVNQEIFYGNLLKIASINCICVLPSKGVGCNSLTFANNSPEA